MHEFKQQLAIRMEPEHLESEYESDGIELACKMVTIRCHAPLE